MRLSVHSATFGLFVALALASADLAAQTISTPIQGPVSGPRVNVDPCSILGDPQPNVTRYRPAGRVWPGGKIVFEGTNLDPSRFIAAVGNAPQAIILTIGAATPTRIEATVPVRADGGPYTPAAGDRLTVSYRNTAGCRVLNPNYVIADAFTVRTQTAGQNSAYFTIRHQMNLDGNIEGARTIKILNHSDNAVLSGRGVNISEVCDWHELPRSSRGITLTQNEFHNGIFGFMFDHRTGNNSRTQSVQCKLPVDVVIQDPATNTSVTEPFLIPMTVRNPRVITVDSRSVLTRFQGIQPTIEVRTAIGDCGKLYEGDPSGDPKGKIGVTVQGGDWVFSIKSGITPTVCRYNSTPVEAQLGVAFGAIRWETTKAGDASKCTANTPSPTNPHLLDTFQVYMSCDIGPLGDNGVTARATGIDLLVPFEMTPPTFSQEVPN